MGHATSFEVIKFLEDVGEYLFGRATQGQDEQAKKLLEQDNEILGYQIDKLYIKRKRRST